MSRPSLRSDKTSNKPDATIENPEMSSNDIATILTAIQDSEKKLEGNLNANRRKIEEMEVKMNDKMEEINENIRHLTNKTDELEKRQDEVEERQSTIEDNYEQINKTIQGMCKEIKELKEFKTDQIKKVTSAENKAVMAEYHNKKYNSILYNWPETKAWESPDDSRKELSKFLQNVLGFDNPDSFMIANCHRLGAIASETDEGTSPAVKARPMIFRVLFWKDRVDILQKSQSMLKDYNLKNNTRFGISQQLPKRMQMNKQSLLPKFREARQLKCSTKWKIDRENALYYLTVDGNDIYPQNTVK